MMGRAIIYCKKWSGVSLLLYATFYITIVSAQTDAWLTQTRFLSYTPSEFHFKRGLPVQATRTGIQLDLRTLRRYANGLILYSTNSSTGELLELANELNYDAVVLGVWDIHDRTEISQAITLAGRFPALVRGIAVGNEGLFWKRYSRRELSEVLSQLRAALPNVALTTTEPFAAYLAEAPLLDCAQQDFLLPTIHPVFESWFTPTNLPQAVEFVDNVTQRLRSLCKVHVLIKETGVPSGPVAQHYSEQRQSEFWQLLLQRLRDKPGISVAMFEAFDAPWKVEEVRRLTGKRDEMERYWGFFTVDRKPKPVAKLLTNK
jgi:exo-beta-1,3-glucanase (GH17 family)